MKLAQVTIDNAQYVPSEKAVCVEGWCVYEDEKEPKLELIIDGQNYPTEKAKRFSRPDVEAIYGESLATKKAGFKQMISLKVEELLIAKKLTIVDVTGEEQKLLEYQNEEIKTKMTDNVLKVFFDEQKNFGKNIFMRGWLLSSVNEATIEVFASDGEKIDANIGRNVRPDVAAIYPGVVADTDLVGFTLRVPVQYLEKGIVLRLGNKLMMKEELFNVEGFVGEAPLRERLWKVGKPSRWTEHLHNIKLYGKDHFKEMVRDEFYEHNKEYYEWIKHHCVSEQKLEKQRKHKFAYHPKISIVIPLYNTPLDFLKDILDTVCAQSYANWELCLADGSDNSNVKDFIRANYGTESRIIYEQLADNKGISENTNQAIKLASGEFVMFSDHDDTLEPDALYWIVNELNKDKQIDAIYTDEDKLTMPGDEYYGPHFKPDFNLRMLEANNYICHIFVVRKSIIDEVGMLRSEYDGAQDYDMILRCVERARKIGHIDKVLYHWRSHPGSTAGDPTSKAYAYEAGRKAVAAHFDRLDMKATVESTEAQGRYRTRFEIIGNPLVSILIPNKDHIEDLDKCIESIETKTSYQNYEIIIIENNSEDENTSVGYQTIIKKYKNVRMLKYEGVFNYASINNFGAREANGEYLLFLNNDTEVINNEWLTELIQEAMPTKVGIVGAKLYYQDNTIQHAGVVLGLGGIAGHVFCGMEGYTTGYVHRPLTTQEISAVTAACMLMKRQVFDKINGFDEQFAVAYNDVDLCLRAQQAGYKVIFTPYAELYHYESKSRGLETGEKIKRLGQERKLFYSRWKNLLKKGDPYYNKNLSRIDATGTLRV